MKVDLLTQIKAAGLPLPVTEYSFHPVRKWRFDFAWPAFRLAVEKEGGTENRWNPGRHNRPEGYAKDCEKYSTAALGGWTVLRFTSGQIASGQALKTIELALKEKESKAMLQPQEVKEIMDAVAVSDRDGPISLGMKTLLALHLIATIQVAARHPAARMSSAIKASTELARKLQEFLALRDSRLDRYIERGWHEVFDTDFPGKEG
jgi:hypothetical protein